MPKFMDSMISMVGAMTSGEASSPKNALTCLVLKVASQEIDAGTVAYFVLLVIFQYSS